MEYLLFLMGMGIGIALTSLLYITSATFGTLKIDRSDPGKDIYKLEVEDLDELSEKKRIMLKIDNHADLSQ